MLSGLAHCSAAIDDVPGVVQSGEKSIIMDQAGVVTVGVISSMLATFEYYVTHSVTTLTTVTNLIYFFFSWQ